MGLPTVVESTTHNAQWSAVLTICTLLSGCNLKESLVSLPAAGFVMVSCESQPIKLAANPGGPFRRYPQRTERCVPTGVIDG